MNASISETQQGVYNTIALSKPVSQKWILVLLYTVSEPKYKKDALCPNVFFSKLFEICFKVYPIFLTICR